MDGQSSVTPCRTTTGRTPLPFSTWLIRPLSAEKICSVISAPRLFRTQGRPTAGLSRHCIGLPVAVGLALVSCGAWRGRCRRWPRWCRLLPQVAGVEQDDLGVWCVAAVGVCAGWGEVRVVATPDGEQVRA